MNRTAKLTLSAGLIAAGGAVVLLPGAAIARAATTKVPKTFEMYANVDAAGDLGSNAGASGAKAFNGVYIVTFVKPIGSCAITAQSGKAGGGDTPHSDISTVEPNTLGVNPDPVHQVEAGFVGSDGYADSTPFMLTLTCTK